MIKPLFVLLLLFCVECTMTSEMCSFNDSESANRFHVLALFGRFGEDGYCFVESLASVAQNENEQFEVNIWTDDSSTDTSDIFRSIVNAASNVSVHWRQLDLRHVLGSDNSPFRTLYANFIDLIVPNELQVNINSRRTDEASVAEVHFRDTTNTALHRDRYLAKQLGKHWKQNIGNALRLWLLHQYGGIYLDLDMIMLRSLSALPIGIGAQVTDDELNNAALKFPAAHPFVKMLMREWVANYDGNKWGHNGPRRITETLELYERRSPHAADCPVARWPVEVSAPVGFLDFAQHMLVASAPREWGVESAELPSGVHVLHTWHHGTYASMQEAIADPETFVSTGLGVLERRQCPLSLDFQLSENRQEMAASDVK
jgi:Glycosyltransferase sugar-binding region containing DXD motif/Alpha 1,4-glycosyltransferase conserved region